MTALQSQFIACAKEYARLFGEIIGKPFSFWGGESEGHVAIFSPYYSFTLEEMCLVVDNLSTLQQSYGDIGKIVLAWFDYTSDLECRNSINLWSWLHDPNHLKK